MTEIITPKRELIKPGWYKDIPNNDYHGGYGTSSSQLKTLLKQTGTHFDYSQRHKTNKETDNMALGTAFHTLTLEPEMFEQGF